MLRKRFELTEFVTKGEHRAEALTRAKILLFGSTGEPSSPGKNAVLNREGVFSKVFIQTQG